jgi:hypothetical protein
MSTPGTISRLVALDKGRPRYENFGSGRRRMRAELIATAANIQLQSIRNDCVC